MSQISQNPENCLFVGVDGGGTKTKIVIIDHLENVISEARSGPSNPMRVGVNTAIDNISEAIFVACERISRSPYDIESIIAGLAGVRRQDFRDTIQSRLLRLFPKTLIEVVTDAEIALFGTSLGEPGIVIISGTGSICFGKNRDGKTAVSGGWGPIAGDEGGGISIAKKGLQAIAKAMDGRDRETILCELGTKYFRASDAEDLIVAIYSPTTDNKKIAGFAKQVVEAALEGDQVASEIINEAGFELGLAGCAVIKKLGMASEEIVIGTVGSVFGAGELLTNPMLQTVRSFAPNAFLKKPELEPAVAASKMALDAFME